MKSRAPAMHKDPLIVNLQSFRVIAAGCALVFLLAVLSTFLVVRYLADSAILRDALNRSYEIRLQTQRILSLLDHATRMPQPSGPYDEELRLRRYREMLRLARLEMTRIESAIGEVAFPKKQVLEMIAALKFRIRSADEPESADAAETNAENVGEPERRSAHYGAVLNEIRLGLENINDIETLATEGQILEERRRNFWGQALVIMILSGMMLAIVITATLAVLLLPGSGRPAI